MGKAAGRMMRRFARGHVEEAIRARFPGRDVTVDLAPSGTMRVEIHAGNGDGTLILITGDTPSTVLDMLMTPEGGEQ